MIMSKPSISSLEKKYVADAMEKGDIGVGEYIGYFEHVWATYNNRKFGVSCNSGTNAIYLALKALGIGPGDEVIVPEYTMIATAWAVSYTGATPVFVDCGDDLLMDWSKVPLTARTRAIITVPIYGRKADYKMMREIPWIEDMAEAHGIMPQGDIACYSFYGNKILTTGEGGMCLTNNPDYADKMRLYANMYMDEKRTMIHKKMGHNFRMTNLQAAVGFAQTMRLEEILEKREKIQDWYDQYLPEALKMPRRDVLWMYDIQTDHQEELKTYLEENGIPTRYGFKPMSMQPQYLEKYEHLNAYKWSKRILYLPTFYDITEKEVKEICSTIRKFTPDKER
jgi:perosamine synthetase